MKDIFLFGEGLVNQTTASSNNIGGEILAREVKKDQT